MDLLDSPDEAAFRAEARAWLEAQAPLYALDELASPAAIRDLTDEPQARAWSRALATAGYAGITWPTEHGGRCHDLLGSRCDPYLYKLLDDRDYGVTCHNNLTRAVAPFHLTELDVHDVLNVFQVTGLDPVHEIYFMEPSPARPGDFFEFFAEIDLLCAISTCPSGDLSQWGWGPDGADPIANCHPIGVEVYELAAGVLDGWSSPQPVRVGSTYSTS